MADIINCEEEFTEMTQYNTLNRLPLARLIGARRAILSGESDRGDLLEIIDYIIEERITGN